MPSLKFNNDKEIEVWNNMKEQLRIHNSYKVKNSYYKKGKMNEWEQEKRNIENDARLKIIQMQKLDKEKKAKEMKNVEFENILLAAEALVMMRGSSERPQERKSKRPKNVLNGEPPRRSKRIAEKEIDNIVLMCPGCKDNQPNQMAHIGPNGCLGDDLDF